MSSLRIDSDLCSQIIAHGRDESPREACGILAGIGRQVKRVIPLSTRVDEPRTNNATPSIELEEYIKQLDSTGMQLIGFYHLRADDNSSSALIDLAKSGCSESIHIIVGLTHDKARFMAWDIRQGKLTPVSIHREDAPTSSDYPDKSASGPTIIVSAIIILAIMLILSMQLLPAAPPIP